MLTLHLTLTNNQVTVRANGKESHQFSLLELSQSEREWRDFYKTPRGYGEKLFNAMFRDAARAEFDSLSKQPERTIVLILETPELDGVAWEYAYNKAKEEYVVEEFAFVRALPEKERPTSGRMKNEVDRVPLLFIPANPLVDLNGEPMRALDVDGEWREMKRHIEKSNAPFDMIELRPATPEALQSVMARFQNGMIAHFSGHGAATKDGAILLFERENGASNPLEAREFVREIKDKAWIGFLSACQSAVPERTEFSNLARELAKAGVPFALGMQFNLPDPFAPNISGQFYNYLAHGHAVPEAARQARRAVKRENEFFVGMIALYAAHPDEVGKLSWRGAGMKTEPVPSADVSDLPSPASGLIGRQRELMRIGTRLLEGKKPLTVTLHGAGGIGKTALLWQALLRFAPSFELTLAIGLDPLPSLESVLGRIERFLGLPSPCSNDTKERETIVRNALTSKCTLLGLDNFETLNYALNEKGSDEEKTAKSLHTFFKSLAANGVTLCVTSRDVTNLPGETIEDIQGLTNESGGRLFQENVVKQKDEIYIEKTQQVSEMVGGHPLALRLLASAFDDQVGTSLDQYIEELNSHLPKARDKWTEEDRHESLRASFDFSMKNLVRTKEGKGLQIALSRLSVFIAFFANFTAAPVLENYFPEEDKEYVEMIQRSIVTLHSLWERGLLERNTLSEGDSNFYFYRLYPALSIFVKEKLTEEIEAIREIYGRIMNRLALISEKEVNKNSVIRNTAIRAVPDLLVASDIGNNRDAALMRFRVSKLLRQFGLNNEALNLLEKAQNILSEINDLPGNAATLDKMAEIYNERGDSEKAIQLYEQALAIEEKLGTSGEQLKSGTLRGIANIHEAHGNLSDALQIYQQSLEIAERTGDLVEKSSTLQAIADIYQTRGDVDGAVKLYEQIIEIDKGLGDLQGLAITMGEFAKILVTEGNLEMGLRIQEEKLKVVRSLGNKGEEAVTLAAKAQILDKQDDLEGAMKLYKQALEIVEETGDLKIKSIILHSIANIYVTRGNLSEAMKLYEQSLVLAEKLGNLQIKSDTLHAMANIFLTRGDLDGAMKLYEQSLDIAERLGNLLGKSSTLNNMGVALFQNNKFPRALRCFVEALTTLLKIGARPDVQTVINLLVKFRQTIGSNEFDTLWQEEIGQPIPDWLSEPANKSKA